jgi:peptidoglycan L-alanyl-D-glutamate endopeptidase CwlK
VRLLHTGTTGPDVIAVQQALRAQGFNPGKIDGSFGPRTEAAVIAFQKSEELLADGVVGPRTARVLGLPNPPDIPNVLPGVTTLVVSLMFPDAPVSNIERHLATVLSALVRPELTEKCMVLMSLATIRAETASFSPISEGVSRFNTSPHGHPFDLYDNRKDLGNTGRPDGERFRGRGFVQLTGRSNYEVHGVAIGEPDLVNHPERANDPAIASRLLASFIKTREQRIKEALLIDDLARARRLVNGGGHGLDHFREAYRAGQRLIPDALESHV